MMEEKIESPVTDELPLFRDEGNTVPAADSPPRPAAESESAAAQDVPADAASAPDAGSAIPGPGPESESEPEAAASPVEPSRPAKPEKTPPSPGKPVRNLVPPDLQPTPEFGKFLRRVREANGISLDELSRQTRIKRSYIEAVERESYSSLPAVVYALAYIKVLASYYGVDDAGIAVLTSEVRQNLEYEAPEENKTVVGYEPSDENQILLRRIILIGSGGIVLLAVLITLAVLFFFSGRGAASDGASVQGGAPAGPDEDRLVELQPKPVLRNHILPVPRR